jgi:hypothetical protein
MFTKLDRTKYPPTKPLLAWDGDCGFCKYWVMRWKTITGEVVEYQPYSQVAHRFPDIELRYFKQAVRFIDTDGKIYGGPAAAFQAFTYGDRYRWVMPIYRKFKPFESASDHFYSFISKRRPFMYKVCVVLWGRNPVKQKPYWLGYLAGATAVVLAIVLVI